MTGWLSDLFQTCLCASSPMERRPWWGYVGGRHRSNPSPGAQQTGRAPKTWRVGTRQAGGAAFHVTWGAEAGNHVGKNDVTQGTEAGAVLPEQEALESQGEGRGDGPQSGL